MKINKILVIVTMSLIYFINLAFANQLKIDAHISSEIENKISANPLLKGAVISIKTFNSIVKLSGKVDSDMQAKVAIELAQATPGVTDVHSADLMIKGRHYPFKDSAVTTRMKGMFIQQKYLQIKIYEQLASWLKPIMELFH